MSKVMLYREVLMIHSIKTFITIFLDVASTVRHAKVARRIIAFYGFKNASKNNNNHNDLERF